MVGMGVALGDEDFCVGAHVKIVQAGLVIPQRRVGQAEHDVPMRPHELHLGKELTGAHFSLRVFGHAFVSPGAVGEDEDVGLRAAEREQAAGTEGFVIGMRRNDEQPVLGRDVQLFRDNGISQPRRRAAGSSQRQDAQHGPECGN